MFQEIIHLVLITLLLQLIVKLIFCGKTNCRAKNPPLPPGPSPWPVVGSIPEMWRNRPAYRWVHRIMEDLDTDIACIRLGNSHVVSVRSPELAKEFLKKHDVVFCSRPETMATRILSRGFITAGVGPWGEQWRKMRRVMGSHVFNHSNIIWMRHKRNLEADNLIRFIYTQCTNTSKGKVINVRTAAKHYSASVMRRMMFDKRHFGKGRDDGGPGLEELEHVEALGTMLLYVYAFSVSDYLPWLEWLDLDGHRKNVRHAMEVIKKYQDPIVNARIREWRDGNRSEPQDLLDVFISLSDSKGNPLLSDEEVRAQATEVFLTLDNPYNVAEWTLAEMLNKPELMEKAVEEIDRVVGKDRLIEEYDVPNLPFLNACANETLRLHPVAPFNLPHKSTADSTVAGYFIPKGSTVILSRLGLGRNPRVWFSPLSFDPYRHFVEGDSHHVDLAEDDLRFVTFSTGRRGCPNMDLGSNMIMMLLGRILQGFSWKIPDGADKVDMTEAITLFMAKPFLALAKPRLNASVYLSLETV